MNGFGERSRPPWTGGATPSVAAAGDRDDAALGDLGTSMNAISFGFAATAILISMFLLMAIFEHLVKRRAAALLGSSQDAVPAGRHPPERLPEKLRNSPKAESAAAPDLSVMMPGQRFPTYLAQPAPLPCPREGVRWPPHDRHSSVPP